MLTVHERKTQIMKAIKYEPGRLINSKNELYGACRHKPRFHRYTTTIPPVLMKDSSPERVKDGR